MPDRPVFAIEPLTLTLAPTLTLTLTLAPPLTLTPSLSPTLTPTLTLTRPVFAIESKSRKTRFLLQALPLPPTPYPLPPTPYPLLPTPNPYPYP